MHSKADVLLHSCCAPCATECADAFYNEGLSPVLFWDNPNIHPLDEYQKRKDTLMAYAQSRGVGLVCHGEYGLEKFTGREFANTAERCGFCYRIRLEAAAEYSAKHGFSGFSTTLLISPYQNHELLLQTGQEAAGLHGTSFIYQDFRHLFRKSQNTARQLGLYRQKYCGCIFSRDERFSRGTLKD
ncbi:MAG: epoxyqueuosine reductase QueH [Oscillospiraceae bacterium]|nr:epoxyqueuosine reductase QueH [Oscillospiraceae bacterium]